jgi:hypothetical protein
MPQRCWAIAIKRSLSPRLGKGFDQARADLQRVRTFAVTPSATGYPLGDGAEIVGLTELAALLREAC